MWTHLAAAVFLLPTVVGLTAASPATGSAGWRGDGTGHYPSTTAPLSWSPTEHVVWRTPMPAWGNASPIVVGDRVFVTAEPTTLLCADRATGRILWRREHPVLDALDGAEHTRVKALLADAETLSTRLVERRRELSRLKRSARKRRSALDAAQLETRLGALSDEVNELKTRLDATNAYRTPPTDDLIGYAASTPVSDGRLVFVLFANGVLASWTLDGQRQWIRHLGAPAGWMNGHSEGHAASPRLVDGLLIVGFGRLRALDPATGADRWTSMVWRDFGAPAVVQVAGQTMLVSCGGAVFRLSDGEVVASELPVHFFTSPIPGPSPDTVLISGATTSDPGQPRSDLTLLKLSRGPSGVVARALWQAPVDRGRRHHASALLHQGLVYTISSFGVLTVVDVADGAVVYSQKTSLDNAMASPAAIGDRIYLFDESGNTLVIRAGRTFELLATNPLEPFRATPFAIDGELYARGHDHLWRLSGR